MNPLHTAYALGQRFATQQFNKEAEAALGDPAYWQGGAAAQQQPQQPATAEEAVQQLPPGTFQGLTTRITPEGQRTTAVKVTPEALSMPDHLVGIFQVEPEAKVEVAQPQPKQEQEQPY
jgi:hypothetical protein